MSIFKDISAALEEHLDSLSGLPPIAGENLAFEPEVDTLFIKPSLLPSETVQASLGNGGTDKNDGLYQISIFAPSGEGKFEALEMADLIADHFKRGTTLTYNSRVVNIKNVSRQVAYNEKVGRGDSSSVWYHLPLTISYTSFTQARV